jgi:hypothetical protein
VIERHDFYSHTIFDEGGAAGALNAAQLGDCSPTGCGVAPLARIAEIVAAYIDNVSSSWPRTNCVGDTQGAP